METNALSRRDFLAASAMAAAGLTSGLAGAGQPTIRCGFVGVGNRGSTLLRNVLKIEGVEVVAICDTHGEDRKKACDSVEQQQKKRPEEYEGWNKLLERDDIAAVVSALPCNLHYPLYRDALVAGKHLYGEKPMVLEVSHADDLVKRARKAGTVFQVGYQRRFSTGYRASVKAMRAGIIGKPFEGRGIRYGSGGPYRKPGEWFSFRKRSGDWMLEQAVHHWDGLNWALDELPASAYGAGHQDLFKDWDPQRDVSDYYTAVINYKSGLTFSWGHTWASPPDSHFRGMHEHLVGPKGAIDLAEGYVAFRKDQSPDGKSTRKLAPEVGEENITLLALTDFFDCVRTGRAPFVSVEEGRKATLFGLLVRTAVYRKAVVTMDEILKGSS